MNTTFTHHLFFFQIGVKIVDRAIHNKDVNLSKPNVANNN
jgi:hypothetical protein